MSHSPLRATIVLGHGYWSEGAADCVVLDAEQRRANHVALTGVGGLAFLLDLPVNVALRGGDALQLDDGRLVEVVAAPEALAEIRCANVRDGVQMAWQLGNRHMPVQILARSLRIRRNAEMEEFARRMGAKVVEIAAPFDPEGGAYVGRQDQALTGHEHHDHVHHDHSHHDHVHHAHDHSHAHAHHDHSDHGHVHDENCGHDHTH